MIEGRQLGAALLVAGAGLAIWSIGDRDATDTHTIDDMITEVRLETGSSNINVKVGDKTSVKEQRSFWGMKRGDVFRVDGDKLILTDDCGWRCDVDFVVTVPANTKVTGDIGSGDLLLEGVGSVNAETGSGDVTARGLKGDVKLHLGSGDVEINGVTGAVDVEVGSGDINATGLADGKVTATTGSGDIDLKLTKPNSVTAETNSGDLTLTVPESGSYKVVTDTGSGDETVKVTNTPNGEYTLDLRTSSGDIDAKTS